MSPNALLSAQPCGELLDDATVVHVPRFAVLDEANSQALEAQLDALVRRRGRCKLLLDMRRVDYLTSTTLNLLAGLHDRLHRLGGRLLVRAVKPQVYELFEITRLNSLLDVQKS
jgi:anti-sigma B factor antagonist